MVMRKHTACKRHGSDLNSKPNTMTPLFVNAGVFFLTKPGMYEEASGNTPRKPLKDLTCNNMYILKISGGLTSWRVVRTGVKAGLSQSSSSIPALQQCLAEGNSWSREPMPPWGLGLYSSALTVTPGCALSRKGAHMRCEMVVSYPLSCAFVLHKFTSVPQLNQSDPLSSICL